MNEVRVSDFKQLHDSLSRFKLGTGWIFRGHSDPSWELKPRAGRLNLGSHGDQTLFKAWKRRAIEYIRFRPENDWDWLAIAQHHGLATRLLDWTQNPLAAAFFAVREEADSDAVVWAMRSTSNVTPGEPESSPSPFEIETNGAIFRPSGVVPRIVRQSGLFTVHGDLHSPMELIPGVAKNLAQVIIDRGFRKALLAELSFYGINDATMFADLDGLSSYCNWWAENVTSWSSSD